MCFNGLYFVLWKDTSVTLAVRRPKQFALYTIPNKLSSREVFSTKNISSRECCTKDWKFFISWRLNNIGRSANGEKFAFQTFSLTSQYAVLGALNMRSSLLSFFSCPFFFKWNIETWSFTSDSMGSLWCWMWLPLNVTLARSEGVSTKKILLWSFTRSTL